jgi:hypothetical protein
MQPSGKRSDSRLANVRLKQTHLVVDKKVDGMRPRFKEDLIKSLHEKSRSYHGELLSSSSNAFAPSTQIHAYVVHLTVLQLKSSAPIALAGGRKAVAT